MIIGMSSDSYWPRVNGATISIDTFRNELTNQGHQGHQVHLFVPHFPEGSGLGPMDDHQIYRLPSKVLFASPEDRLTTKKEGHRNGLSLLEKIKPEILHAQTEFSTFRLLLAYKKSIRYPWL